MRIPLSWILLSVALCSSAAFLSAPTARAAGLHGPQDAAEREQAASGSSAPSLTAGDSAGVASADSTRHLVPDPTTRTMINDALGSGISCRVRSRDGGFLCQPLRVTEAGLEFSSVFRPLGSRGPLPASPIGWREIQSLETVHTRAGAGALVGAAAGLAVGMAIGLDRSRNIDSDVPGAAFRPLFGWTLLGAVLGTGGGAVVGSTFRTWTRIYDRPGGR